LAFSSTDSNASSANLIEMFRVRAAEQGSRVAFRFLADGETEESHLTYRELDERARSIAALLAAYSAAGERALLYYAAGLDFIAAFCGCLYAGVVAVPVFPARLPRHIPRLLAIAADSGAKIALTTGKLRRQTKELFQRAADLKNLVWLATDEPSLSRDEAWRDSPANLEALALLQYTSGSTAEPRGVMVTHGNLLHNLACLREIFGFSKESVGVTWLPHYHDMGLVGGLLQPLFAGGEMTVMSPSSFLQRPARWLAAVTRYQATTIVAPNFAYDLCARKISVEQRGALNLASVNIALCGAEPVRVETLDRFAEAFEPCGFRREAFRPAYGLAEATLIVSGRAEGRAPFTRHVSAAELRRNRVQGAQEAAGATRVLTGCGGIAPSLSVAIVDPETFSLSPADQVGEIWVSGPSVARGYWNKSEETKETFDAYLATGEGPYLRTGDLGFLDEGQLFVTGRCKDLVIIRGANHYPQDLEHTVERSHRSLRPDRGAAFSIDADGEEQLVIVQEVDDRSVTPNEEVVAAIRAALAETHEVQPIGVVLIKPRTIPRTSSGKIQRYACREAFLIGALEIVFEWRDSESRKDAKPDGATRRTGLVWDYLSASSSSSHRLSGNASVHGNGSHAHGAPDLLAARGIEPIAIVGIGCRFPGAANLEEFWRMLRAGVDAITEIPRDRWDVDALYDPVPGTVGKMSTRWGGFLPGLDRFDPHFFGISPREAAGMDPQQRLLLEVTWEALENAGQPPDKLAGSRTGVFVGVGGFDYSNVIMNYADHLKTINAYLGTGNAHSIAANRISYLLDLRGPSVAIDTACSSSLVAIHMACESLRGGQTDLGLAGGVNLILSPEVTIAFSHAHMMAADGRCKTFDARADGYVRAEGCGVVVLKRLSDALRDRDNILALIRGSAVNQDGRTAGIAAPNGTAQQSVIREALVQAGVAPEELTYIEAHGTGTSIGDPIEIDALKDVLGNPRPADPPCIVGSVKANIGHLENASGMAGLAKVLTSLDHGEIPGQLHFTSLNPRISLSGTRIVISREPQPWPRAPRRLAGISSFGFGGTNAHVIVEEAPPRSRPNGVPGRPCHILTVSARTESALKNLAGRFEKYLAEQAEHSLADVCFSANAGRSHFAHRLAVVAENKSQLREGLAGFAAGTPSPAGEVRSGHAIKRDGLRVVFLFGAELTDAAAASQLYDQQPVFRKAIDRCARFWSVQADERKLSELFSGRCAAECRDAALFALEYALAELWQSWGIQPDAVLGTGVGEYAAAVVSGILTCEDALPLIAERGRILRLTFQDGELDRALEAFETAAAAVRFQPPRIPFVSGLSGEYFAEGQIPGADFWRRNVLASAHRDQGIAALAGRGYGVFLEVGPPSAIPESARSIGAATAATWLSSLEGGQGAWQSMLASLASLYVRGASVDWVAFDEPYLPLKVPLPTYPFDRERCWEEPYSATGTKVPGRRGAPAHPLLGERLSSALPMAQFQSRIGVQTHRYLNDHRIRGSAIFPAAAYIEMARAAAVEILGDTSTALSNLNFQEAMILPGSGSRIVQLVASPVAGGSASFQVFSSGSNPTGDPDAAWTLHASGDMRMEAADSTPSAGPVSLEDIQAIQARCPIRKTAAEFYEFLKNAGLEYGPSFRGVKELWCGSREALGAVCDPSSLKFGTGPNGQPGGKSDDYWIPPVVLDSCVQVLAAALPEDQAGSGRKRTYLPSGVTNLRFHSRPGARLFSHCVIRPDGNVDAELLEADIRLLDEEGRVSCELLGFRVKPVADEANSEGRENPGHLLYDVAWVTKRPEAPKMSDAPPRHSWLILADRGGVGRAVAAELQSKSENCTVLGRSDLRDQKVYARFHNFVDLSGLDLSPLNGSDEAVLEAQNHWIETMRFIQGLLRTVNGSEKRLWIVTRGAQSVGPTRAAVSLAQTPVWGLAKSIDLEHPDLSLTRIDLDPSGGTDEIAALAEELLLPPSEHEIAFRKGTRYASRLVPRAAKRSRRALLEIPTADSFRLDITRPGNLDNLKLREASRSGPGPGEVQIRVLAAGLNFRDVMNAAGVYPGGPIPFGAECSGTVAAVGSGVTDFKPGDDVIAVASGSFASYVTADARAVVRKPASFSFEQAATVPIAFLTAHYSLHYLAKLSRGERVLIHAAAGGVGLAAVQLAQHAGAEIFATAGSPEKRSYLKPLRVPHILDSRSLDFADEVMQRTNGRGVDVVLNSLSGEYITRSLSVLAAYGRFVEIGRTDIFQNKPLGLFPFRNNLSYFALDLERVCRERPDHVRSMLLELMAMFEQGSLQPLHHQVFFIEDSANAFRYMARRKNIGKIVLSFPTADSKTRVPRSLPVRSDAAYLITGGHGGLGLAVARWLVEKGARSLILLSRSGASRDSEKACAALTAQGATITTVQADVSSQSDISRALDEVRHSLPPLRGVIHAAGVLDDHSFLNLDEESFRQVLAPKVLGAWNLHNLTAGLPLDFFVVFSSVASVLGSPGQANYAAANAFLDGLAHERRARGLPCLSVNWGPWADVGMAARAAGPRSAASRVMPPLPPARALAALDRLFQKNGPAEAVVMSVDWSQFARSFNGNQPPPLVSDLIREKAHAAAPKTARDSGPRLSMNDLLAAPPAQRHALLLAFVRNNLAQVMSLDASDLDPEESLSHLGIDSLMALELQHSLEERFGAKLPIELLMGTPSLNEFVTRLLDILTKPANPSTAEPGQEMAGMQSEVRERSPSAD
jgi:phthiocerol/phenolphthiocerol synthesis type-I polyketide synthase C